MDDSEVVLLLLDNSFLQNGKKGLLITNKSLYSSSLKRAIPLREIVSTVVEKPTEAQQALFPFIGPLCFLLGWKFIPRLVVNGDVVYKRGMTRRQIAFLTEFLPELASSSISASVPQVKHR